MQCWAKSYRRLVGIICERAEAGESTRVLYLHDANFVQVSADVGGRFLDIGLLALLLLLLTGLHSNFTWVPVARVKRHTPLALPVPYQLLHVVMKVLTSSWRAEKRGWNFPRCAVSTC